MTKTHSVFLFHCLSSAWFLVMVSLKTVDFGLSAWFAKRQAVSNFEFGLLEFI